MTETLLQDQGQVDPSLQLGLGRQDDSEQIGAFDALRESSAVAETLEMFQGDRLLARAIDGPRYSRHGLEFDVVDSEMKLMENEGGMQHVSSTLLAPNESIRVYKPLGFLVDSERVGIEHVAEGDSLSSVDDDGQLQANNGTVSTLPELAQLIHETHTKDMNEVNISLPVGAVRGLFTVDAPRARLDALVTRHHLRQDGKGILPLFIYGRQGSLEQWEPTAEETAALLGSVRVEQIRTKYAEALPSHDVSSVAEGLGSITLANS